MAKSRRFSTAALIIATMAVLIITLALVIWLPEPGEMTAKRTFAELSQVHIGPIRWSEVTLQEAVADVNAQLEKKGETRLRLFVSDAFVGQVASPVSMQLEEVPVTVCARYLCDLFYARMSGAREGLTFGPHGFMRELPWRVRVRHWVSYNLWERWKVDPFAPAPSPPATAPGPSPALPASADPFAPAGAP